MGLVLHRPADQLTDGIGRWLSARRSAPVRVVSLDRPAGGYSSETLLVETEPESDAAADAAAPESLVVRLPPPQRGLFPDYDLAVQAAAQRVAADAGVPIAGPVVLEEDPEWLGAPFLVMPRVAGHVIGDSAAHDRWVRSLTADQQRALNHAFLDALAAIHRADPGAAAAGGVPVRDNAAELDYWDGYLGWSSAGDPLPVLRDALQWCRAHRPASEPAAVLRWGDVRFGNVIFGDDLRPRAVIDWDMTAVGAPEHDIAWLTMLEWTITELTGRRAEGMLDRAATVARHEAALGRPLADLDWYETLALTRSTAVMARVGYLQRDAGETVLFPVEDNPVLGLLARRIQPAQSGWTPPRASDHDRGTDR